MRVLCSSPTGEVFPNVSDDGRRSLEELGQTGGAGSKCAKLRNAAFGARFSLKEKKKKGELAGKQRLKITALAWSGVEICKLS